MLHASESEILTRWNRYTCAAATVTPDDHVAATLQQQRGRPATGPGIALLAVALERDQRMWSVDRQGVVAPLHFAPYSPGHDFGPAIQSIVP
jgi:hypothetical protein